MVRRQEETLLAKISSSGSGIISVLPAPAVLEGKVVAKQ